MLGKTNRRFSKAKVIRSVAILIPRPLCFFIIRPGSSYTPESQAQHLSSRGPVLACTTTRLDHAKSRTKRSLSQCKIGTMLAGIADVYLGGIGKKRGDNMRKRFFPGMLPSFVLLIATCWAG